MSDNNLRMEPLPRAEVIKAVERKRPSRIPLVRAKWWGEGLTEQYGERLRELDRFPEDVHQEWRANPVDPERMGLSWTWEKGGAHDSACVLDDWGKLDEFIEKLPRPENEDPGNSIQSVKQARAQDRYVLYCWWNLFFEKPWGLRGMQNLLCDYYLEPDHVHKLQEAMCNLYCRYLDHVHGLLQPDGFWTSDDLGHQTGPMMSPAVFHEFIFPYYKRVGDKCRELGMHFWLHSCGDNTLLLKDLADAGLTVFHPVQKHTMNEQKVVEQYGDRLAFLAGIDVQHTLQEKDPAGVREEVRFLIDTFDRPEGGMCIAAGNGIVGGTPLENIEAFLEEALVYGRKHRERFK